MNEPSDPNASRPSASSADALDNPYASPLSSGEVAVASPTTTVPSGRVMAYPGGWYFFAAVLVAGPVLIVALVLLLRLGGNNSMQDAVVQASFCTTPLIMLASAICGFVGRGRWWQRLGRAMLGVTISVIGFVLLVPMCFYAIMSSSPSGNQSYDVLMIAAACSDYVIVVAMTALAIGGLSRVRQHEAIAAEAFVASGNASSSSPSPIALSPSADPNASDVANDSSGPGASS